MVVEYSYITVIAGREAEFESAFAQAESLLSGSAGCQSVALFRDAERHGAYLLRVTWERLEDHLEVFPASTTGKEFVARIVHFFDGSPDVRHFSADPVGA